MGQDLTVSGSETDGPSSGHADRSDSQLHARWCRIALTVLLITHRGFVTSIPEGAVEEEVSIIVKATAKTTVPQFGPIGTLGRGR